MSPLTTMVPAIELRIGDRIETPNGDRGEVSALQVSRGYVVVSIGSTISILKRDDAVRVVLEDEGR
jgi:hypothetical protein